MKVKVADQSLIDRYVTEALLYPLQDLRQLISMVILHFDIPDDVAKETTIKALATIKHSAFITNLNRLAPISK